MNIMLCYDESEESREALREAQRQAKAFNGTVLIVTSVISDHKSNLEPYESGLQDAKSFLEKSGIDSKTMISLRAAAIQAGEDLASVAKKEKVEEIIIGIRNKSRVGKLIFGSDAQYLILNADCPVITVRKK